MKRAIFLATTALFATPAYAGPWTVGPQPVEYPTNENATVYLGEIGDGSNAQGGTPPAAAYDVPDVYGPEEWDVDLIEDPGAVFNTESIEAKARFICNDSHINLEDPILAPGEDVGPHPHQWIGNQTGGKDSDYAANRAAELPSLCQGRGLNQANYWHPAVQKNLPSGAVATIRSDYTLFYYFEAMANKGRNQNIPNFLEFIGGKNPMDMDDSIPKADIPAGFKYENGFKGWQCAVDNITVLTIDGDPTYPALQTEDGEDPWGGNCVAGGHLIPVVWAPQCWDGVNGTSPDGRSHVIYGAILEHTGEQVCPDGWYYLPVFESKSFFSHNGWEDYSQWFLSSDRMDPNPENWITPGKSWHFDWQNGHRRDILNLWLSNCIGVTIDGVPGIGADCGTGGVGPNLRLSSDHISYEPMFDKGRDRFFPIPAGTPGPFILQGHAGH